MSSWEWVEIYFYDAYLVLAEFDTGDIILTEVQYGQKV
jgi:hypothetical protein